MRNEPCSLDPHQFSFVRADPLQSPWWRFRLTPGVIWYNYNARATAVERGEDGRLHRVGVRTNDFFPTFDLIFRSS